ncbi:MAG: bifunctional D-glycero-beta-D-manno-heptose-7-phosphate kinase/D-glycero-beta-D-manno-heptose 1-phosphate adenylyltransferase HldE [Thermodesulfobacteriota bacterium]|nr:bifunctional D-glycero-beta-D-manno-heptose-7-phosphate kinase/D-glycero-beta-D-manno-heptose 1-phosphate adenylyltransferase HldE [Thermodesulfobacteriota bacterium]
MTIDQIQDFLQQLPQIKALVVGDLMLDEYLWGRTGRISPEAPVPVVDIAREDLRLGGAGNVVNNLRALGCQVAVCSVLGDDDDGRCLYRQLEQANVDACGVVFDGDRKTSRKTRILASNQQMLRIDRESRLPLSDDVEKHLLNEIIARLDTHQTGSGVDVIFLSDYGKGVLTDHLLQKVIVAGRAKNIPVVVDPKGQDYRRYRGATLLTPNRAEASEASGINIVDEETLSAAGTKILNDVQLDALVLTRSEEGMSLFLRDGQQINLATQAREVFDVSGAGDTVLSLVGIGLAASLSLKQAATVANIAAGVVVAKVGTSTVSCQEILHTIVEVALPEENKIQFPQALSDILKHARNNGKKVVFTNGCFDLLHAGHVSYLQRARALGDLLVLGLNSDASVQRLKGSTRPLVQQDDRAVVMAALACIDYVVLFDEDTPLQLIETLRPDILVKGGDYTPETVVGRKQVESWGGRVELIDFVAGKSTTGIVERIQSQ